MSAFVLQKKKKNPVIIIFSDRNYDNNEVLLHVMVAGMIIELKGVNLYCLQDLLFLEGNTKEMLAYE